jgi:hypothetical protein
MPEEFWAGLVTAGLVVLLVVFQKPKLRTKRMMPTPIQKTIAARNMTRHMRADLRSTCQSGCSWPGSA